MPPASLPSADVVVVLKRFDFGGRCEIELTVGSGPHAVVSKGTATSAASSDPALIDECVESMVRESLILGSAPMKPGAHVQPSVGSPTQSTP